MTICNHLKIKVTNDLLQLYADIDGYINPVTLFKKRDQAITNNMDDNLLHRARFDIVLKNDNKTTEIELTVHMKPIQKNHVSSKKDGTKTSKTSSSLQRQILSYIP